MRLAVVAFALAMPASSDWTGRYIAGETAGPGMVMTYAVDVFRGAEGGWRALFAADGHMTLRRLLTRGEEKRSALVLRFVRSRSDDMSQAVPDHSTDDPIVTIERRASGAFALRFGSGGSYLNNAATLTAKRRAIPAWAGHYGVRHCPGAASECWSWGIDVSLEEEGWVGRIQAEGPGRAERLLARGEEGEEVGLGKYLQLLFMSAENAPTRYQADAELLKLVQARDGSVRLRFGALPGPPGIAEAKVEVRRDAP
jgi:hypothetical protein